MISGPNRTIRLTAAAAMVLFLAACGAKQVVVQGKYPTPVIEKEELVLGIVFTENFKNFEFFEDSKIQAEPDWRILIGQAQTEFWETFLSNTVTDLVIIDSHEALHSTNKDIEFILIPYLDDLNYAIPMQTSSDRFEIWLKYRFRLVALSSIHDHNNGEISYNPNEYLAEWSFTAYGKTPELREMTIEGFTQDDEESVNLAAVVALRDAGAHLARLLKTESFTTRAAPARKTGKYNKEEPGNDFTMDSN